MAIDREVPLTGCYPHRRTPRNDDDATRRGSHHCRQHGREVGGSDPFPTLWTATVTPTLNDSFSGPTMRRPRLSVLSSEATVSWVIEKFQVLPAALMASRVGFVVLYPKPFGDNTCTYRRSGAPVTLAAGRAGAA
jgi:hypothetical protein